jgi:hypothetical protein
VSERGTFDWDARVNEWRLELKAAASARDAALAQVATLTAERDKWHHEFLLRDGHYDRLVDLYRVSEAKVSRYRAACDGCDAFDPDKGLDALQARADAKAEVAALRAALGERVEVACLKACGWERRVIGNTVEHKPIHSPECLQARAALQPGDGGKGGA